MGGTFDHMHLGHRLLLSQAVILTKGKLHCGVTSDILLKNKVYKEYMQPIEVRMEAVRTFLRTFNPRLDCNVFELVDPCGVGATLPEIQACVLTREVEKGGLMINNIRRERGFAECELVFVDMILSDMKDDGTA